MALRGTSCRTLVVFFFLVASLQMTLDTACSWAIAPPWPRFERNGLEPPAPYGNVLSLTLAHK